MAEEKTKHLGEPIIIKAKPKNTFAPKIRNSFTLKKPNKLLKFNQSNSNSWNTELETVGLISFILTVIAYGIVLIPPLYPIAIVIAIIALVFGLISLIRFATSDSFYGKGFAIAAILLCAFFLLFLFVIFPATFRPFG